MGVGGGCLPFHFSLLACPLSPQPPSPVGKGEILTLFRRGLRPRHPGNRVGSGTGFYFGSRSLFAFRRKGCPQRQESSTNVGFSGAARVQPLGCKGRSPLHEITLVSPFPPGRGLGGWGQEGKLKAGAAGDQQGKPPLGHHSGRDSQRRHARAQAKAGTGRERRLPPIIIRSRKVLGGLGDSFKSPPAHPRIPASPHPRIPIPRQARRRRARMQKPAVRQAAGRRTATATPQRAEEGRERDREEPSMQTGVTEENSEVKVSLI